MTFSSLLNQPIKLWKCNNNLLKCLGGFHLTKWISNEKEVMEQIPEPERAPSVKVVDENIILPVRRAVGVFWDTNSDCFVYEVVKRNN